MSHLEGDKFEEPEFKWLKEREGKRYRDTHFYESFLYEGVEYSLYDSVYLKGDSEQAPNIGKLVTIWEEANKSKKIRVQWFFRPSEILYYLGDTEVLENELFLASGRGIGLVNITPLESIIGICNVVCTSTDERNPRTSENEEKMADYVFYRTFDVQNCMILDRFNDTIGVLPVEFVFKKKESVRTLGGPKFKSNKHDARNAIACKGNTRLLSANSPNIIAQPNGDCNYMVGNDDTNAYQVYIAQEELPGDVENGSLIREPTSRGNQESACIKDTRSALGGKIVGCKINAERDRLKKGKSHLKHAQFEKNVKSNMKSRGLNDTSLKEGMLIDISLKDNGKNIALTCSTERQAVSTTKNESATVDKRYRSQGNINNVKVKDRRPLLKNACSKQRVQSTAKSLCLNDPSLKRKKLDASEDREAANNIANNFAYVKDVECKVIIEEENVEVKKFPLKHVPSQERIKNDMKHGCSNDASLKGGQLNDKTLKDNGKTSMPSLIISGNSSKTKVKCDTSFDAKLIFEIDKDFGGLRKDVKPIKSSTVLNGNISHVRTSSRKTLESLDVAGFVSHQKNLKSTKCRNTSRGKSSIINDILFDEQSKRRNDEVFERRGHFARHIELSSDAVSQLSKPHVYPSNGEINNGHESFKRKDMFSAEALGDAPSKKSKLGDHNKPGKENSMEVILKLKDASCGIGQEPTNHLHVACERKDLTLVKDSCVIKGLSKKANLDRSSKTSKLSKYDVFQTRKERNHDKKNGKVEGEILEISRRPISEKRTWLKWGNLSWESVKSAHNEGKLVLLQNLDPILTSSEVEDIIWHAFEEKCMVKMVQHTSISSPHNGQALLIFDTREIAERVLKELDDKCLMVLEQRPLVGCTLLLPEYPRKQTTFVGHFSIDKIRRLAQREMKEAVSTSHYAQPNTIEYEMATEWWLLQSKSNIWCQNLFEQHKVELRKLVAKLHVR